MQGVSPLAAGVIHAFNRTDIESLYSKRISGFIFNLYVIDNSACIEVQFPKGGRVVIRAAFVPAGSLNVKTLTESNAKLAVVLKSVIGEHTVNLEFPASEFAMIRYTASIKLNTPMCFPYWPKDIMFLGKDASSETHGQAHLQQKGTRSGQLYCSFTKPKAGSILYLQNLTALNDYFEISGTSAGDTVGGTWPEFGFSLPKSEQKALPAKKEIVISYALLAFDTEVPESNFEKAKQYLKMLSELYIHLPKPETTIHNWPETLNKGLNDLINNHGCWSQNAGHSYFNAYVCDYETPPEIMVQLAVLLPLDDYARWSGNEVPVMKTIKDGLPSFYDEKLKTIMRWLPSAEDKLDGSEEQKMPKVMDAWYLHHPLLNLSRMALKGDKISKKLFLDSLDYAIKAAHHFKYKWPVFYKMDTLEVLKAETQPGEGGEKDVAGLYAHVMLQAWELTGEKRYFNEAVKAADTLEQYGFDVFYQANNTAFTSGAMLRLWKETKNEKYLDLSYLCIASIMKNMALWDCNYGFGKNYPSFFSLFPLNDAPYTAVYEEQEVFCAMHDYLANAHGEQILPSVSLLLAEYIRYLVDRSIYYYPPMLPKEMLSDEVKMGEVDPNLWIALEDLHDGWEKSGEVGQEVYGAGNAFGILPRHYRQIEGEDFWICVDYPTHNFAQGNGKPITFLVKGDNRLSCRMVIVKRSARKLPDFKVIGDASNEEIKGSFIEGGNIEFHLKGNQQIQITWRHARAEK